jgi:SAM-dependent methyltransferase
MSNPQELAYPVGYDYEAGSPHLKHRKLRQRINLSLTDQVDRIRSHVAPCNVLEIGAGHGSFTAVLRNAGATVTVTEMSRPSADHLERVFSGDAAVRVVYDPEAKWVDATTERFDLVVAISVLHHIPDYLAAVARYAEVTEPGGAFVSWQDPLWYPRRSRPSLLTARAAYASWRVRQGNLRRGLNTSKRRIRGVLDEAEVSDMSEYHVVRQGVDEIALLALLRRRYEDVQVESYWSTQDSLLQEIGDRIGLTSSFSIRAQGRLTADHDPATIATTSSASRGGSPDRIAGSSPSS